MLLRITCTSSTQAKISSAGTDCQCQGSINCPDKFELRGNEARTLRYFERC